MVTTTATSVSSLLDLLGTSLNSLDVLDGSLTVLDGIINGNLLGAYEGNSSKSNCGQEFHLLLDYR